ncbi:hypothetical protein FB45DRAFT_1037930 [Roridomyces roridus]|uniref:Uncharacterized protein n=1 Tax=Roridomyces roridus TaxID=1738132 RepID=A0AAD7F9E4_9AGAR|nr:hypothetical protein FB45DRAFT_1037930 [Roridomyces roridus]
MSIPQELIDGIVNEVTDFSSLKSCSLAASNFRDTSQRILYRRIKLKGKHPDRFDVFGRGNYAQICTLLQHSSRLASFITRLEINLPHGRSDVRKGRESIKNVLGIAALANVRWCRVDAAAFGIGGSISEELLSDYFSILVSFLNRQPLHELELLGIRSIPMPLFLQFLAAAPVFTLFHDMDLLQSNLGICSPPDSHTSTLECLTLGPVTCSNVCELLFRPELSAYTAKLRSPAISLDSKLAHRFISYVASSSITLPPIPGLRSVEFDINGYLMPSEWLCQSIPDLLGPGLTTVIFTFKSVHRYSNPFGRQTEMICRIDDVLEGHAVDIKWRLASHGSTRRYYLLEWIAGVKEGMPKAHARGRLVIEIFDEASLQALDMVKGMNQSSSSRS